MANLRRGYRRLSLQLPLKGWFSSLTAILGAFAGLLGSVFTDQIKNTFPFAWGHGDIVWPAVAFWVSVLIFGWFFGLGFNAQNEATNKLEQVVRTLPPKDFLEVFEDLFTQCFRVDWKAQEDETDPNRLKGSIEAALTGLVGLVKRFDARRDRPQYSANIMLFRPIAEIPPAELRERLIFTEPGQDAALLGGVLQLQPEFAYTSIDGALKADTVVAPIMLPIPQEQFRTDGGKPTVLPGAPAVFCDPTKHVGFENTLQLAEWCRQSGLRPSVAEKVNEYFTVGLGKEIRSFISVPIVSPATQKGIKPEVLGILNIHCNREGILPGEKTALFVPLAHPFVLMIGRSLHKYRALSKAAKIG